jgi:NAD+ kinase
MGEKAVIFYNSNSIKTKKLLVNVKTILKNKKIPFELVSVNNKEKPRNKNTFAVCIGGDGTVLYASHFIYNSNIPMIAINSGGLGFLSSVEMDEVSSIFKYYFSGKYKTISRSMLEVSFRNKKYTALNDCVIKTSSMRSFYLDVFHNEEFLSTYFADGIIISTPTGSTAYALSSGGPIVGLDSKVILVVPISPHTLTHRPVIIPENSIISLYPYPKDKNYPFSAKLSIDGQIDFDIKENECVKIKIARKNIKTIVPENYSYFEVLRKKLSWGERSDRKS